MLAILPQTVPAVADAETVTTDKLTNTQRAYLNQLRLITLKCRAAARANLFEACAILSTTKPVAKTACAEVLIKCLGQALGKPPKLFRPGVEEVSFDEAWLVRATEMAYLREWDSFEFLLRSRVPEGTRRNLASLIIGASEHYV
ncbi:MAG: hypothetical protein AAGA08_08420 [Pseudomonadota bacterium]